MYIWQAGDMHPTGMLSYLLCNYYSHGIPVALTVLQEMTFYRDGNVFTGVCLSTGVGWLGTHPSPPYMGLGLLRDTVDKWAVRIPLECFLVLFMFVPLCFSL